MDQKHRKRIQAGRKVILDEIKPSRAQLERGLRLHAENFVADVQGSVPVNNPVGLVMDRLEPDIEAINKKLQARRMSEHKRWNKMWFEWQRWKTFESVYDPKWRKTLRELYKAAGVNMGSEDVTGPNENTMESALAHIARSNYVYQRTDDTILIHHADDIKRAARENKPCIIQHMAGVGAFAEAKDPIRNLDLMFGLGVRMMQLTYIQKNKLCCSWMQDRDTGLTAMGRKAVARMNELGIMVDLAHCGDRSTIEIIEASSEPVLLSHTACRSVYDDASNPFYVKAVMRQDYASGVKYPKKTGSRNASDETLKTIAANGGIAAFYTIDYVVGEGDHSRTFDAFVRHLEHAVELVGADHVAFGTDRTYFPNWAPAAMDWTNWPYWTVGLVCRGFTDSEIRKIIGGNFLRYARRVLNKKPWGPFI